nr:hypothetical protein [Vicinamibacteria bacterium]
RDYLAESLFLNSVTYENEMLAAYVRRLSEAAAAPAGRKKTPTRKPSPKPAPRPGKAATPARPTLKARKATKKKAR